MNLTTKQIESFKDFLVSDEKSEATIQKYIRDVTALFEYCGSDIDKGALLGYKEHLMAHYAPRSVNSAISSLNSFFKFASCGELHIKTVKIQRQIFSCEEKELSKSEYKKLLEAAHKRKNKQLYYLMQTICSTGIRVSELKFITVEALGRGAAQIYCKSKMRTVLLSKELCRILRTYIKERRISRGSIFVSRTGKPLDRSNIWAAMKGLCRSAAVAKSKVFPHNLRHLFARTFYALQKDIVRLADILGHCSVDTTRIYTMESSFIHRRQIESLGLLGVKKPHN